jgi:hypothetical protein
MGDHDAVERATTMGLDPVITMAVQVITMRWNGRSRWSGPPDHDAVESVATITWRAQESRVDHFRGQLMTFVHPLALCRRDADDRLMSLSNEWYEWHLTPRGWVIGSQKLDFGGVQLEDPPPDRVLTIREREFVGAMGGKMHRSFDEEWGTDDDATLKSLADQYGWKPQ